MAGLQGQQWMYTLQSQRKTATASRQVPIKAQSHEKMLCGIQVLSFLTCNNGIFHSTASVHRVRRQFVLRRQYALRSRYYPAALAAGYSKGLEG